ncbi:UDP-2,4-diacetamido-2,4,6-trideoxy-beta-L-altropyranose hydrolase [Oceaniradius stylonematis]|uniref:UDP-2,4-diacetamido-2,4, 6-trideoxy-beta-L-altropyranose hydrolase n=1 Tax=Oceaniradius stylonematis TaxID=2184161 RepID=UPI003C7D6B79
MKTIVFRADASKSIGGGHVYRCLALSQELLTRGWDCELLTRPESIPILPSRLLDGVRLLELRTDELTHLDGRTRIPDIVLFDHYRIGHDVQSAWRNAGCLVAVIDDCIDRPHDADLLVNPDIIASEDEYRRFVGESCRLCLGPSFAFVRQEFVNFRAQSLRRRRMMDGAIDAFVSFGLTDPGAGCLIALSALEAIEFDGHANFVTGAAAFGLEELRRRIDLSRVTCSLHVDPDSVSALMQRADLAIGAGGSSSWERCTLGVPSVVMSVAAN